MYPVSLHNRNNSGEPVREREFSFGPLLLETIRMMVRLGLAGSRVQPCPRIKIELVWLVLALGSWLVSDLANSQRLTAGATNVQNSGLRELFGKQPGL